MNYYNYSLDLSGIFQTIASVDVTARFAEITAPLFSVADWYDMFLGPQLLDYQRMLEQGRGNAGRCILVDGPWPALFICPIACILMAA